MTPRLLLSALLALEGPAPQDAVTTYGPGWSAVHADASNSDYHPRPGASDLSLAWSRRFDGMINLGPTSDGLGRLYLTTSGSGCRLHALDRETGRTVWCTGEVDRLAVASSPLIDRDGVIYLADGQAMRAFGRSGEVLWRTPIIGVPLSAQFTRDGDLIFITHVGVIYRLRRRDGTAVVQPRPLIPGPTFDPKEGARACMRGTAACPSANTPAIDHATGRMYFTFWTPGAAQAGIRAVRLTEDPPGVEDEWRNDNLPGGSASSPTLSADRSRLYLTDNRTGLHALDAATGRLLWSVDIGYAAGGSPSVSPEGLIMPAGGREAPLLAVRDLGDRGEILWRRDDLPNRGIATQAGGHVAYATVSSGGGGAELALVDTRTGEVVDRESLPGRTLLSVGTTIDLDGTVYLPGITGSLHAFRPVGSDPPPPPQENPR